MKNAHPIPSQQDLRRMFDYNDEDGALYWRDRPEMPEHMNEALKGQRAGHVTSKGRWRVEIYNVQYLTNRVIWVWHHGDIPDGMMVDHIDGDTTNNRIGNLRLGTNQQNQYNRGPKNGRRYKGVHACHAGWKAEIALLVEGRRKLKYLGVYCLEEEAALAYNQVAKDLHGEFAKLNEVPPFSVITDSPKYSGHSARSKRQVLNSRAKQDPGVAACLARRASKQVKVA